MRTLTQTRTDARHGGPRAAVPVLAMAAVLALATTSCKSIADAGSSSGSNSGSSSGSSSGSDSGSNSGTSDGRAVSPLANPDGTKPGLAPITSASDRQAALKLIGSVPTRSSGSMSGYSRDQFGAAWTDTAKGDPLAGNGCDTRNDILARDGEDIKLLSGSKCTVGSMTLPNPYKGDSIQWTKAKASSIQIDHVLPLGYAWQMGSSSWTKEQRTLLANDTLNLLAVDGPDNSSKGDSGPSEWLPPSKDIRCSYVVRFAQVALKYKLSVTSADKTAMLAQCGG